MFITSSIGVFWGVIILMVILLLIAKKYLTPSGNVNITINGQKKLSVPQGASLPNKKFIFPRHAAAKVRADNANARLLAAEAKLLTWRNHISHAASFLTITVSVVR